MVVRGADRKRQESLSVFSQQEPESNKGANLLQKTWRNYDTGFGEDLRDLLGIRGLVPPSVETFEIQKQRCLLQIRAKTSDLERFTYLTNLRASNTHLFYRLLIDNMREITPLVYTPVIGEACLNWSHIYSQPEGMYISIKDKGKVAAVLKNWPQEEVDITVITDGSRILGLGDLGVNGMGIPVGKLALYVGCAGIRPEKTLPITLDLGTDNQKFLDDPLYLGLRQKRAPESEKIALLDELMQALREKWPRILVQFEDFKEPWFLSRYQSTYSCFNDDIQGTGAVILAGFINAVRHSGIEPKDHRLVFYGAGSAGVGVARQLMELFVKSGLTEDDAKSRFYLCDSKGLITANRGDKLAAHKVYFAREDNGEMQLKSLEAVVDYVKPTALVGLCTMGGVFTPEIIKKMAELNKQPIIMPLSNPSVNSECTFAEAMTHTNGTVIFASGSPFADLEYEGKIHSPGQGNNMYVFPGIGIGSIIAHAKTVSDDMIYAAADSLAKSLTKEEYESGALYPELFRIRDVSAAVATGVIRQAQKENVDDAPELRDLTDEELTKHVRALMYDPKMAHVKSNL